MEVNVYEMIKGIFTIEELVDRPVIQHHHHAQFQWMLRVTDEEMEQIDLRIRERVNLIGGIIMQTKSFKRLVENSVFNKLSEMINYEYVGLIISKELFKNVKNG